MASTLYICYFGVREPLVQTQVIPYLVEIGKSDVRMHLLTFEPVAIDRADADRLSDELRAKGIEWTWLRYHKWPSAIATAYDIFRGTIFTWNHIRRKRPDVLHCRVHVPGVMAAIARKLSRHKPKLLFDIRGFFPEEFVDAGIWPADGWLYRSAKRAEQWLMKESDGYVVLTEKAREILFPDAEAQPDGGWGTRTTTTGNNPQSAIRNRKSRSRPVEVIPCCVDFGSRFAATCADLRKDVRRKLGIEDRFVITHVGALGGLYLTDEIADFLAAAKSLRPETFALFLTQTNPDKIVSLLEKRGFERSDFFVGRVTTADVPGYMCAADVGLSFVKAGYATQSRSPTKIPEYLACGVPVVANTGVGDVDTLIDCNGVGVIIDRFSTLAYKKALDELRLLGNIGDLCRATAIREFDLESVGGFRYRRLYSSLQSRLMEEG